MIGYRFLLPAEEEMTEAAIFYENASATLGVDFLHDIDRVINLLRNNPLLGQRVHNDLKTRNFASFPIQHNLRGG